MLTRASIDSGEYLESFDSLPQGVIWDRERIYRSLEETLRAGAATGAGAEDVWIFAYGSLIWNPLLRFDRQKIATLHGWRRSFCLNMITGRGNAGTPGRMLAVEPGNVTHGIAFHVSAATRDEDLRRVWIREMVLGAYRPIWADVVLADGTMVKAIVFAADPAHAHYEADASVDTVAPLIAAASGVHGDNAEYVYALESALIDRGLTDPYVQSLANRLRELSAARKSQHSARRPADSISQQL